MADGPLPGGKYEFAERDEHEFVNLARYMRIVGTFMLVFGALTTLGGLLVLFGMTGHRGWVRWVSTANGLASGTVWIVMASFLYTAAHQFKLIADTTGRDIKRLMTGVEQLTKAFATQAIGFCLQLLFIGLALIVGVVVGLNVVTGH